MKLDVFLLALYSISWKKSRVFVLIICECSKNKLLKILLFNYLFIQYLQHNREVHQQNYYFFNKNGLSFPIKKSFLILFLWIKLKPTFWLTSTLVLPARANTCWNKKINRFQWQKEKVSFIKHSSLAVRPKDHVFVWKSQKYFVWAAQNFIFI